MRTLQELHDTSCSAATSIITKRKGGLNTSLFVLYFDDDTVRTIFTPWSNNDEKLYYIDAMRSVITNAPVRSYSFITEAWMAVVPANAKELANIAPRHRSDREDVMMVLSRSRDGEHISTKYHVDYTEDGHVILGEPEPQEHEMSGLIGNMFKEPSYPL